MIKQIVLICTNFRMALMLLMGFSSGLPIALAISTLQAWVASEGLSLKTVGIFTLVQLPYQLKFLWAPIFDWVVPPFLGRRRGWMLITQLAVIGAILLVGSCNPVTQIELLALCAVILSFTSASQDVVIDGYRAELLTEQERGSGMALAILGYRLGMIVSGSLALILADQFSWHLVYSSMAACMIVGIVATLIAPEPALVSAPRTLMAAVIEPLRDFLKRAHVVEILLFVFLYKIADVMALALSTKFMLDTGFSKTEIGVVYKGFGLAALIVGSLIGATLMARWSVKRSLLIFGIAQAAAVLGFALLAFSGKDFTVLATAVFLENLTSGMGTAAFGAFLMGLCHARFSATQYALLSAISSLPRALIGPLAAYLVAGLGWTAFFIISALCGAPALVLLQRRFEKWQKVS